MMEEAEPHIDEHLYSRQLYVIGHDAMRKVASSSVLVSGLGGLGVELAKNIILAGVKQVALHDQVAVRLSDLASNFYLSPSSIGQNRAAASHPKLSALNEYVRVTFITEELTDDILSRFHCVVITTRRPDFEIRRISSFCHQHNIKLILTETRGVFGYVFLDFGKLHTAFDLYGKEPSRFLLAGITTENPAVVTVAMGQRHELNQGG
jgi:ubiquitin-activating enzyme E1